MGTWGHEFDQNDDAADFIDEVHEARDWSIISSRIHDFVSKGGYEEAQQTVAALELVATAMGRPPAEIDADLAAWGTTHGGDAEKIRATALQAVDLIATKSELSELWAEAEVNVEDSLAWRKAIGDLKVRLVG